MAEKEVTLKILADVDDSQVQDLETLLQQIIDGKITIPVETETNELEEVEARIEELEQVRADIYMGVSDEELDAVEAEINELESQKIELSATVDSSGINETSQDLDNLEKSASNAGEALETMANLEIAQKLSEWGSQAESYAHELDNIAISTEQLAIQTGMTDSEMTGMLNNITNATFPRDEALMYVQSLDQIGVSAQNLGASATGLDRINDAFHMGAPAVNKLGQELSVLGVDMNNVSSSFNALAYANANTVGGMDNFSKFLTRFDSQFHELGLNVDQAAVAIAGATHKFGGGRAALSGMSEALKNCNGDLSVLEQELGLEAGALTNASQLTGQYNGQLDAMADKEAQHKTLTQQLAAALDDVAASCNGALAPFSSFIGVVGNAGSFAVGINALGQLSNSLLTLLGIKKAENAEETVSIGLKIRSAAASAYHTVVETARSVVTKAVAVAQALLNAVMMANPIVLVVAAIVALIAILWYLYTTNESVRNAIDGFGQALWGLGEAIYSGIAGAIQWLIDGFTWLYETISGLFTTTGSEGINWLTTIMMVLMGPIGWIMLLIQHWDKIAPAVSGALSGMYQNAVNWFNQTGARIHSFASDLVSNLGSAAWNAVSSFESGIRGIASAIAGELDRAWSTVVSWGQQLIQRFWQIAVDAVNALKKGLGIGSPGFMYYMVEGELNRIDDLAKYTDMPSSFSTLGNDMVNNFNPQFSNGSPSAGAGGVVNNFNFTFTDFIDDKEKLTDLIIKTITDEINWNNNTANRMV